MRYGILLVSALALTACTDMKQGWNKAQHEVKATVYETNQTVRGWFEYTPPPERPEKFAQVRYCYKAMTDIVCYDSPQAGKTAKLVGYQGPPPLPRYMSHADGANYVMAAPTSGIDINDMPPPAGAELDAVVLDPQDTSAAPRNLLPSY